MAEHVIKKNHINYELYYPEKANAYLPPKEKDEYEITKLKFKSNDSDNYEVTFDAKITLSDDKWQKTDENFKKNAMDGLIEVEFNLEEDGELFIYEEGFVKDCDGQTELFVD